MSLKKPCYIWDECLIQKTNHIPAVTNRASLVHGLLAAYDLLKHMKIVRSCPATDQGLKEFHSELYLNHLKTLTEIDDEYMTDSQDEEYGLGYDCPPVSNLYNIVATIAGGSITAAKCLLLGLSDVAINWCGGWHHAQRFSAGGFCYVNDIVLAIEKLKLKFHKILYIDLDVHHGNGVQDAYNLSKSVFTLSFHKYEAGFYPGSGDIDDIGTCTGKGYKCNIPLHGYYNDDTLEYIFERVFTPVYAAFIPDAIVVQCGADALSNDPHGGAGLTERGYKTCLHKVLDTKKPTLILGGGGYKHTNTARLWANLTALVIGVELDENIPEHDEWDKYGPDYLLPIQTTLTKDLNTKAYVDECIDKIKNNLKTFVVKHNTESLRLKRNREDLDNSSKKLTSRSIIYRKKTDNTLVVGNYSIEDKITKKGDTQQMLKDPTTKHANDFDVYAFGD